jgi:FkbM family methyltransferase
MVAGQSLRAGKARAVRLKNRLREVLTASRVVDRPLFFAIRELLSRRLRISTYVRPHNGPVIVIAHPSRDLETLHEIYVLDSYRPPSALRRQLANVRTIVDVGANVGLFSAWAIETMQPAEIIAVEADPANATLLRRCLSLNSDRVHSRVVEAIAASKVGTGEFLAGFGPESRIPEPGEPGRHTRIEKVDVFDLCNGADLVKIDIEGGEWELLTDPRFASLKAGIVLLEHHPRLHARELDPRTYGRGLLEQCGFRVIEGPDWSDGYGILWGVR